MKNFFTFLICGLLGGGLAFGQQLTLSKKGNLVRLMREKKVLYSVALHGQPNENGKSYDQAFLAGECLIVRRNVRERRVGTEIPPKVSQVEIYQANGKKRIYRRSNLEINWVDDSSLITSPDFSWAIIPDIAEGTFWGYFHISPDCQISQVTFPEINYDWGWKTDGIFVDFTTLKFPNVVKRISGGNIVEVEIYITRDGRYQIKETNKN